MGSRFGCNRDCIGATTCVVYRRLIFGGSKNRPAGRPTGSGRESACRLEVYHPYTIKAAAEARGTSQPAAHDGVAGDGGRVGPRPPADRTEGPGETAHATSGLEKERLGDGSYADGPPRCRKNGKAESRWSGYDYDGRNANQCGAWCHLAVELISRLWHYVSTTDYLLRR